MVKINSEATENFIKTIYKFEIRSDTDTRTGSIAKELNITNAAATDMSRKLAGKGYIIYEKYKPLKLTHEGENYALQIIRKHRILETFLYTVLNLNMHEIHRESELLEHASSDFLIDKIYQYLGSPTSDPHGDPIPDKTGAIISQTECLTLSVCEEGYDYKICRLAGMNKEFYDFCSENGIKLGESLFVKKIYASQKMIEIKMHERTLLLNTEFTSSIFVKKAMCSE